MTSQPPFFRIPRTAYVPGQTSSLGVAQEWISLPKVAMMAALVVGMRAYLTPPAKRVVEKMGECNSKYCHEIHVDAPKNTLLKDQSLGRGLGMQRMPVGRDTVWAKVASDYRREQLASPGVNLVAHTVA